ncbi:MAG: TRAP transporter small permease [Alcaligenaceae bacterium]|nr:TRAP transporter small permease [Alcaligenaceae bacterium]
MKTINAWLESINQFITLVGGAAVALMMIHVSLDIFFRFALNQPLPGTITIVAHYYMIIAIFLPLAYVEQTKSSISIELISAYFPPAMNRFMHGFTHLFISATSYLIAYVSYGVAIRNFNSRTSIMQGDYTIPTWPTYFILFAGVFLLGTYCLLRFIMSITGRDAQEGEKQ